MDVRDLSARLERISAKYAALNNFERTDEWVLLKLTEEVGELVQAHLTASGQSRDRGLDAEDQRRAVATELADVIGMCLIFAHRQGIDVEEAVEQKWLQYE